MIRKVHSLKTTLADVITTVFITCQRHLLSTHRYLAVCGTSHEVRQTRFLFIQEPAIVCRLCWEHTFCACHWWMMDTPCHYLCSLGFWFSRGGGRSILSFLFILLHKAVFHPPRRRLRGWVGLVVAMTFTFDRILGKLGGFLGEAIGLLSQALTGQWLPLSCDPYSHLFCPPWSRLWAS